MNTHRSNSNPIIVILIAITIVMSACQAPITSTAGTATNPPAQPTTAVTSPAGDAATQAPAAQPTNTQPAAAPNVPAADGLPAVSLEAGAVAQNLSVETVAAVPASNGGPGWEVLPKYRRLTLTGYPVANHMMKPQIFIYPVAELGSANEAAGKIAANLQALLQTQQVDKNIPFLPMFNAAQVMHAKVQFVDFKNGKGVRFLTQFDQAPIPINNYELFYTFQGLTSDGKYYIAAVLPINMPDLPVNSTVNNEQAQEMNDFQAYMAKTVEKLNQAPDSGFTPDLTQLDAIMQSIEVK